MRDVRSGARRRTLFTAVLLAAAFAFAAFAQEVLPRRSAFGGNRLLRPGAAGGAAATARGTGSNGGAAGPVEPGGRSIEFNGAPVEMVFTVYGDLVGKTVLKDPQVPAATITLQPQKGQELTDEDKIEAIETVLEMNGIHLEPYGEKFVRAIPRKDVRKDGIPLIMDPDAKLGESTRVVSLMIPFKNIAIEEAQKALEGFKSNSGILLVFERTNSILATDTEQIINRMREIAKAIDIASPVTEVVEYIQIKYASANEVKQVIDSIVQESMKEQEKNGKAPANNGMSAAQRSSSLLNRPLLGGVRRPGQANQPNTPANNPSLVMTVSDADRGMIRGKVVTIADERSNKILIITNASNMKFFKEVIAALDVETTPDTVVKVYRLKYAEAEDVSDMINDLIGNSSSSKGSGKGNQNQAAKTGTSGSVTRSTTTQAARKPANQRSGEAKAGELNKDNTTVLADKRINGLVVMTDKELVPTIEQIIEAMDIKLSQVLIETVIIEVTLGDELKTGIDWVQRGRTNQQKTDGDGNPLYWAEYTTGDNAGTRTGLTTTDNHWTDDDDVVHLLSPVVDLARDTFLNRSHYALGGGGGTTKSVADLVNNGIGGKDGQVNPVGTGINYILKSDKLNLAAVIEASKSDSRTKFLASPIVMTLDNKEAVINATRMRYLLKGFTSSGNSYSTIAVPDYEQKELGIEIKVTPKINPNGTVMLTVEEKYSQLGVEQEIKYAKSNSAQVNSSITEAVTGSGGSSSLESVMVPTTVTREMSADVLLENMQTVVFGGLTETTETESETGIPILKDIPIIGKWLFGSVRKSEQRNELLVFMTPYVLDEGAEAQAEALRRKKVLSDQRPWEDHGWSLSPLADPVAKKEQMRRIKEEWRKQDEERKTKLAIEKMKIDRAKKLQSMSKEERDLWLKMHKEELDDEAQDELEEKMLDEKSQEELRALAARIRQEKLGAAEKDLKAAAAASASENERGRLDAEKKETEGKKGGE